MARVPHRHSCLTVFGHAPQALLKEIFQKMYESNAKRIKQLQDYMKANKKRIAASELRVAQYSPPPLPMLCVAQ